MVVWSKRHLWFVIALIGVLWSLSVTGGCNCDTPTLTGENRELVAIPGSVSFDGQEGQVQTKSVEIRSRKGLIQIEKISIAQGQTFFTLDKASLPGLPFDLDEGKSFTVQVSYKAIKGRAPIGLLRITSDATSPKDGKLDVQLLTKENQPLLAIQPDPVDFGFMTEGQSREIEVVVENKGSAKLEIETIAKDPKSSPAFSFPNGLPKAPMIVEPGKSVRFKVKYIPTPRSPDIGAILFTCKGSCAPSAPELARRQNPYSLKLIGKLAAPAIDVAPNPLDFGSVPSGKKVSKLLQIKNVGSAVLKIASIAFKAGSSGTFSIPQIQNVQIQPGQSSALSVEYLPVAGDTHTGIIEINNNDPGRSLLTVPVKGRASAPDIEVKPKVLNFGKAPIRKVLSILVSNVGDQPLKLNAPLLVPGSSKEFSFAKPPAAVTITPGKFVSIGVVYAPKDKIDDTGTVRLTSNDPDEGTINIPLSGRGLAPRECNMQPNTAVLQFGVSLIGKAKRKTAIWTNNGSAECQVSRVRVFMDRGGLPPYIGPDVFVLPVYPTGCPGGNCNPPLRIKPGGTLPVEVAFAPVSEKVSFGGGAAPYTGTLDLTTDGSPALRTMPLSAIASGACVSVLPDKLDFGLVTVGCASRKEKFIVYNSCRFDVTLTKLGFAGTNKTAFQIAQAPRLPYVLKAGKTVDIALQYKAKKPPTKQSAIFQIEHNFKDLSPLSVTLAGTGTTSSNHTDTFKQPKAPQADILFVIDNSCSMGDEQAGLSSNLSTFIKWASQLKADFQIGITTTEIKAKAGQKPTGGILRGPPRILTPQTPNLLATFRANARVGTGGGGIEQVFEAAKLALSPPNITTGVNKGFLRKDASLSIIAISDEPEQSPDAVAAYLNFFRNLKGGPRSDLVRFHAVIGYDVRRKIHRCKTGSGRQADEATSNKRYTQMVKDTKGLVASICNTRWSQILQNISLLAFGTRKRFYLTRAADPKSISVKINGKVVATGPSTWAYDGLDNSILFQISPPANATIQVSYKVLCF